MNGRIVLISIGFAAMTCSACADSANLADMLPARMRGWTAAGPDGVYTADTLYDYIDGAAEVYRSFNVRKVVGRRYVKEGSPEIIVDVFDMGSSEDAYGAYHHDIRDGEDVGIGQESEFMDGNLAFWKERYFVSIVPFDETAEVNRTVSGIAAAIAAAIPKEGRKPAIVGLLPETGLQRHHLHYFHNHLCLNIHYYLGDKDLLNLGRETEGVIARYKQVPYAKHYVVMVVRYPSVKKAKEAYKKFVAGHLPDATEDGIAQTGDGKWAGVHLAENLVIGVFDAPAKTTVEQVIKDVIRRKDTKITKKPE